MIRIGIDLGGTNIKTGLMDEANHIIAESTIATRSERPAWQVVDTMAREVCTLMRAYGIEISALGGVGIGSPGAIDRESGVILYSNNFAWKQLPLVSMIREHINASVQIANDAQCAALGESIAGAGKDCRNLILITLGTGVGGGIILNGEIFGGAHCGGGVVGHMVIVQQGEQCTCGRRGCLETYASASALIRETRKAALTQPDSALAREWGARPEEIDGHTVFDVATKYGDTAAQAIIDRYIDALADGIANLIDIFRPEMVLVSGGVCNQGDTLLKPLNRAVRIRCFAGELLHIPQIRRAHLGNSAGMIGAAALCTRSMKGGAMHR